MIELMLIRHYLTGLLLGGRQRDERGVSTEVVIWIAIGAGLALAAGAILVAKVMDKANSVNLG
jgi:hypothetical protein